LKKVVIVTSGQPAGNPRMVKEALFLSSIGFQVTVIYCLISSWGNEFDKYFIKEHRQINWIKIGVSGDSFIFTYFRLRRKFWDVIFRLFGNIFDAAIKSQALYVNELEKAIKNHNADIFIGHNLASISAIVKAKNIFNAIACFDFEDFHRGEEIKGSNHWIKVSSIEDKYINHIDIATTSSDLISKEYKKLYPNLTFKTILNVFPFYIGPIYKSSNSKLRLFWFSQFIGSGRGLETIVSALGLLKNENIELTILGNITNEYKVYIKSLIEFWGLNEKQINICNPVPSEELIVFASKFDIGLCTEESSVLNRDLCLTNKLFTYLNAGNAVILSNTKAQNNFLNEHPNIGFTYSIGDMNSLSKIIDNYYKDRNLLYFHKASSRKISREKFNWEIESNKLISIYKIIN
jgi:glycosyltransferase involved in cell wall biosynthesis